MLVFFALELQVSRQLLLSETYERFIDRFGHPDPPSTQIFLLFGALYLVLGSVVLLAGSLIYVSAFTRDTGRRFEKKQDEPDAVGQMLADRQAGR